MARETVGLLAVVMRRASVNESDCCLKSGGAFHFDRPTRLA